MNGRFYRCARCVGLIFLLLPASAAAQGPDYDFIISGAHMVDGTGAPWVEGDIAIAGDRIVAIGDLSKAAARKRLDAKGLVVSPGFIDVQGQSEFNVLVDNRAASKITQGVTTEITGEGSSIAPVNDRMKKENEEVAKKYGVTVDWSTLDEYFNHFERTKSAIDLGRSIAPVNDRMKKENEEVAKKYGVTVDWSTLDEYFNHFERTKSAINLGTFVGAGGVRNYVMGTVNRPASPAELEQMRQLVAQAMQDGAMGISTALEYVPDTFASTDEIVELAKVARQYGGVYFTHQRSETDAIFSSLDEVFAIARRANISTTIWHLKTAYHENFGKMPDVLRRIQNARAQGIDVAASVYPYTRASNGLVSSFPPWVSEGGIEQMIVRFKDPVQRERIKKEMDQPST